MADCITIFTGWNYRKRNLNLNFVIEKSDIDFGSTQIENIFIEDFMPMANGSYVKVYLYAYKNMLSNASDFRLDNEKLAKNLRLTLQDVENAWDYWEKEGVVEKVLKVDETYDIVFKNLKLRLIQSQTVMEERPREQVLVDLMGSDSIRNMFNNVDYFMRRPTTPTEKMEIISWISDFNMSPEMVEVAIEFATEKKKRVSINYVRAIVMSWYDKKLSTVEDIEAELKATDEKYVRKNSVLRKMGLQFRTVSEPEIKLINSWYDHHKFSEEVIDEAISRTSQISRPSINYVNSILLKWKDLGVETLEDIEKKDIRTTRKPSAAKTKFQNFTGQSSEYSNEDLNKIARELTRRRGEQGE